MSLIVTIMLSPLSLVLLLPVAVKTKCVSHLSFNSTFQLIITISNDLEKLLRFFNNGATIAAFFRIPLSLSGAVEALFLL